MRSPCPEATKTGLQVLLTFVVLSLLTLVPGVSVLGWTRTPHNIDELNEIGIWAPTLCGLLAFSLLLKAM